MSAIQKMSKIQTMGEIQKTSWSTIEKEKMSDLLTRQTVSGEKATLAQLTAKRGILASRHSHAVEEYCLLSSGVLKYIFDDREIVVNAGDILIVPPNIPHSVVALEDAVLFEFFAPMRDDWLRGEDQYLRR